MPEEKDYFNIAQMTRLFREWHKQDRSWTAETFQAAALLAQAQQLSVISSRLSEIAETLEAIRGKAEKV